MSDTRQVRLEIILAGRSHKEKKLVSQMDSFKAHQCVLNQVKQHFGDRPIHIVGRGEGLQFAAKYPEFYAAGWFVSNKPVKDTEGSGSELLVMAHGDSMLEAKKYLMNAIPYVAWDNLAKNI